MLIFDNAPRNSLKIVFSSFIRTVGCQGHYYNYYPIFSHSLHVTSVSGKIDKMIGICNISNARHISALTLQVSMTRGDVEEEYDIEKAFRRACKDIVIPMLCSIGLAGNALTFLVLVHRMNDGIETIEKGSLIGMISLAISDFLFCLVTLCQTFLDTNSMLYTSSWDMSLFVTMYGNFMQNIFIKTSTTVTVLMALYRYVALTKPIKMCQNIETIYKLKTGALIGVFIFWTLLYCPLLWMWKTQEILCPHGHVLILLSTGSFQNMQNNNTYVYRGAYTLWAILGFFLPVCILSYCNTCIIISLRRAKHGSNSSLTENPSCYKSCVNCFKVEQKHKEDLLAQRRHKQRKQTAQWQTTVTLVAIILSFFVFICPGELLASCITLIPNWQNALTICHVFQALNMSLNFALYCIINSNFRRTTSKIFCDKIPQPISL